FGKTALLYVSADNIDLSHLPDLKSTGNRDIPRSFGIYAMQLTNIRIPRQFSEPLLNDLHDEQDLNIYYAMNGSIHWNAKNQQLKTSLTAIPSAGNTIPCSIKIKLDSRADETSAIINLEARQAPSGS